MVAVNKTVLSSLFFSLSQLIIDIEAVAWLFVTKTVLSLFVFFSLSLS